MPTVRIPITGDASVTSQYPSKPYGKYKDLAVQSASPSRQAYLWAALPAIAGKTIVKATLVGFERYTYGGGSRQLTVRLIERKFNESTINYTNRPGDLAGTPSAVTTLGNSTAPGRRWEWDVTDLIQHVADGAPWYGMRILSTNSTKWFMWSSEATDEFRPYIEIEYAGPPEKPTGLSPAGGRAISVARPLHRFNFVDTSDDSLAGYQIQWAATEAGFGSPTLDTGTVNATLPQWEPDEDVDLDDVVWWRVRTLDSTGLWSEWADPVSFARSAKSTVTMVSPVDEGTVAEPTPPIVWSVSGTQTAFQVFITDPVSGAILHDSGKRPGDETAYTPPAGVLTDTDTDYRVTVYSWDDVARESIPGDPAYSQTSAVFTLELSDSVDPVTRLTASPLDGAGVLLAWERSTLPDWFVLRVDGQFLEDTIDPASVFISGTSYRLKWFGAQPRKNQAVEVVPIVNGVAASDNPVASVRAEPEGIWLSGTDGENAICLHTNGSMGDWSNTTISQVHQGVGSPYAVVRTQVLGARASRQSGSLVARPDLPSLDEQVRRAHALRNPPGQRLRLVLSDSNVVGCVDQMVVWPEDEFGAGVRVDFDFYEQG